MPQLVFERMQQRIRIDFENSDSEGFEALMLHGEQMLKLTVAGLVACLKQDEFNTRYSICHKLVRANGIGDWEAALRELLTGTAREALRDDAREYANSLTRRTAEPKWQGAFARDLHTALRIVLPGADGPETGAKSGWNSFVVLRNRTRAHGAVTGGVKAELAKLLKQAMHVYQQNYPLFDLPWAYLKRNLSGKYRVTSLGHCGLPLEFTELRTRDDVDLEDGVYVFVGSRLRVELAASNADLLDFYLPNGRFGKNGYELLSYITGNRLNGDPSRFLDSPGARPRSETSGRTELVSSRANGAIHNLPALPEGYVHRSQLESDLHDAIRSPYPIVSLIGRGGIGKTSLALSVLHDIALGDQFDVIVWFSARDVDLLPHGPSRVEPDVLDIGDVARQFEALMRPFASGSSDASTLLDSALSGSPFGGPILFAFDNFETVSNPRDMFIRLASTIRPPNKILITSRNRDFDRDFKIAVEGMTAAESEALVLRVARDLHVEGRLTTAFIHKIHLESQGHPYIIKVLIGAAARDANFSSIRSELAPRDDLLRALFERSFSSLTPLARRVFLTLCSWNSPQNELCVEAVLARSTGQAEIEDAIAELAQVSFIEVKPPALDGTSFLVVPLAGHLFGAAKLKGSQEKLAVLDDRSVLMRFGAVSDRDMEGGAHGRAEAFLRETSQKKELSVEVLAAAADVITYIAHRVPSVWLLLSAAYEEASPEPNLDRAVEFARRYIEAVQSDESTRSGWEHIAYLSRAKGDPLAELRAVAEYCSVPGTWRTKISDGVHRAAQILYDHRDGIQDGDRALLIRRLISAFDPHLEDASATECSRVAWLHLYLKETDAAKRVVVRGLRVDPDNYHCRSLAEKLGIREA